MSTSRKTLRTFRQVLTFVERYYPDLVDTLAIMSNREVQERIEEGQKDVHTGRLIPLKQVISHRSSDRVF
jgi:hypothetical protein